MLKPNIFNISYRKCIGQLSKLELLNQIEKQKLMYVEYREEDESSIKFKLEKKFECYVCHRIPIY